MWKNVVAIVGIGLVLGLIWPNYFKIKTSEELAAIKVMKATTKEFTTCKRRLEDCGDLKGEINELRNQIQAATKEIATCQSHLEGCIAQNHISHEKSSDRLYNIIFYVLCIACFFFCCIIVCCLAKGPGILAITGR